MKLRYTLLTFFWLLISGCVAGPGQQHGLRNFFLETTCNTLENSGNHYQHQQQGYFMYS